MIPKAKDQDDAAPAPKSKWETVFTTTPVVLTILATILAGLSSGEMTRAQYYRAMAAQFQSKATDQWSFFQAKRIRGAMLEENLPAYAGRPAQIDPARMLTAMEGLASLLQRGAEQADRLGQVAAKVSGEGGASLQEAAAQLQELTRPQTGAAGKALDGMRAKLGQERVREALAFLGVEQFSQGKEEKKLDDPAIKTALQALEERQPENDLIPLVLPITEDQLRDVVEAAEYNLKAFDESNHWIDKAMAGLDGGVKTFEALAVAFHRGVGDVEAAQKALPAGSEQADLREAVAALTSTDAAIQRRLALPRDYVAARKEFTARRYRREGDYNLQVAWPYELRVVKSSVASDRYRQRSQRFFLAMLGAQAGTAIASLALAARQQSTLWALAGLAGLAALGFSVYVYLFV